MTAYRSPDLLHWSRAKAFAFAAFAARAFLRFATSFAFVAGESFRFGLAFTAVLFAA